MSINEIIKKYLPIAKQKLSYANKKYNYCSAYIYHNHSELKRTRCNKKLIYQSVNQVSENRWHIYFSCTNNHLVIRWVILDSKVILAGQVKN